MDTKSCSVVLPEWSKQWPKQEFSIVKCSRAAGNIRLYNGWLQHNVRFCTRMPYYLSSVFLPEFFSICALFIPAVFEYEI